MVNHESNITSKMLVASSHHIFGDKKERCVAVTMQIGFEGK